MQNQGDFSLFVRQLFRNPGQISALAPSSERLAAAMAAEVPSGAGPVVELGAGTGKITRALLDHGVAAKDLHAMELNPDFVPLLRARFPGVQVHQGDAQDMAKLDVQGARAVVSGLPFLSLPNAVQRAILKATFKAVQPGGAFIQFTYGPTHPVAPSIMRDMGLVAERRARVWSNLPPARVYAIRRALV